MTDPTLSERSAAATAHPMTDADAVRGRATESRLPAGVSEAAQALVAAMEADDNLTINATVDAALAHLAAVLRAGTLTAASGAREGEAYTPEYRTCAKCGSRGVAFVCDQAGCPENGGAAYPNQAARPVAGTERLRDGDLTHRERSRKIVKDALDELGARLDAALATQDAGTPAETPAARDVLAERRRQVEAEGWTLRHDDKHGHGQLGRAAAGYLRRATEASACIGYGLYTEEQVVELNGHVPPDWPWDKAWWKPTGRRRDLVKAGALILAEIERIDRTGAR